MTDIKNTCETSDPNELLEKISSQVHKMWLAWAVNLLKTEPNISKERKDRWTKECFVEFEELSEEMKERDRKFAREIMTIIENERKE